MSDGRRLPVIYREPSSGVESRSSADVFSISSEDVKRYGDGKICGNCRFFEPGHAQVEMVRTQFLPKLVQELEWKPEHIGAAITSEGGICGLTSGHDKTITATFTVACDGWREDNGRIKRRASPEERAQFARSTREMQRLSRERLAREREKQLRKIFGAK